MNANQVGNCSARRPSVTRRPLAWDFDQVMNHFFGDSLQARNPGLNPDNKNGGDLIPAWEIVETAEEFRIVLDLPGFTSEDISVELKQDQLMISGERHAVKVEEKDQLHVRERKFGKFQRTLAFREPVQSEAIAATLENGVLTVCVPKAQEAQPTKIPVRTA